MSTLACVFSFVIHCFLKLPLQLQDSLFSFLSSHVRHPYSLLICIFRAHPKSPSIVPSNALRHSALSSKLFALGTWGHTNIGCLHSHMFSTASSWIHVGEIGNFAGTVACVLVLACWAALGGAAPIRFFWVKHLAACACWCSFCCFALVIDHIAHNAGNFQILRLFKFAKNCLQFRLLNQICELEIVFGAWFQISRCVAGFLL